MVQLITHTDLDGLGCAILAKLVWKDQVNIALCRTSNEVNQKLDKLLYYDKTYITDLSVDAKYLQDNVYMFDHHKTAEHLNNDNNVIVKVELNGRKTCGTELFYQYLVNQHFIDNRDFFVELVRQYDTWEWTKFNKLPYYLNNLVYILGMNNFIDTFTERLAKKDINELTIFTEDERKLLVRNESVISNYIQDKRQYVKTFEINDKKVGICFADTNQSILGNVICEENNIDIMVMVNLDRKSISFRTNKDDIDVSVIAKRFNGGGHAKASGGTIDDKVIESIHKYILEKM